MKDKTPAFVLADDRGAPFSSQTDVLAIEHRDVEFVSRTKFITEPDGGVRSEYFIERVVRNTDGSVSRDIIARPESAETWSAQTHQYLDQFNAEGKPGKLMIVYEGRTRAVDFKVLENSVNNKNIRFTTIASDMNSMEDITQAYKRNRVPAREAELLKAGWSQAEVDGAKKYELWVRTKDASLTAATAIDRYQAVLAEQLAVGRFEGAVQELGKGPEKALTQARENLLRTRPPAEHEAIRRVFGEKIADAQRIERAQFMEIQTKPLTGDQIPTEIYTRGKRAYDTLSAQVAALQSEFRMSSGEIQSLRLTLGVDTPYIARADFDRLYQEPHLGRPTNANPVGPSAMVRYWAEMNDPATLPKAAWSKQSEPDTTKLAQDAAKSIEEAAKAVAEKPVAPVPRSRPALVPAGPAPVQPGPAAPATSGRTGIATAITPERQAEFERAFPQTQYMPTAQGLAAQNKVTSEVVASVEKAIEKAFNQWYFAVYGDKATFDRWAHGWAVDIAVQAIVPRVAADLAAGKAVSTQDLYLARQGAVRLAAEDTSGKPGAPVVGQPLEVTNAQAQKETITALPEGATVEFGRVTITTTQFTDPAQGKLASNSRLDVPVLSKDHQDIVRVTLPDGKQYTLLYKDFIAQTTQGIEEQHRIEQKAHEVTAASLASTNLTKGFLGLISGKIARLDLATPEGKALVTAVANVQSTVVRDLVSPIGGSQTTTADMKASPAYIGLTDALTAFQLATKQAKPAYQTIGVDEVVGAAILAVGGPDALARSFTQARVTAGEAEPSRNVLVRLWQRFTNFLKRIFSPPPSPEPPAVFTPEALSPDEAVKKALEDLDAAKLALADQEAQLVVLQAKQAVETDALRLAGRIVSESGDALASQKETLRSIEERIARIQTRLEELLAGQPNLVNQNADAKALQAALGVPVKNVSSTGRCLNLFKGQKIVLPKTNVPFVIGRTDDVQVRVPDAIDQSVFVDMFSYHLRAVFYHYRFRLQYGTTIYHLMAQRPFFRKTTGVIRNR